MNEVFDLLLDLVADLAGLLEDFFGVASETGRVFEGPTDAFAFSGEDGAALGRFLVADGNHGIIVAACTEKVKDGPSGLAGKIDTFFPHDLDYIGIEGAGLDTSAFGFEGIAAIFLEKGFSHLAAGRIVDADKEDAVFGVHVVYFYIAILRLIGTKKTISQVSSSHSEP